MYSNQIFSDLKVKTASLDNDFVVHLTKAQLINLWLGAWVRILASFIYLAEHSLQVVISGNHNGLGNFMKSMTKNTAD